MHQWVSTLVIVLLLAPFSSALSPITMPSCSVTGEVLDVRFAEAIDESRPNLPGPAYPDRFIVTVLVKDVSLASDREGAVTTCEEAYPEGETVDIYILAEDAEEEALYTGRIVTGEVENKFGPVYETHAFVEQEGNKASWVIIGAAIILLTGLLIGFLRWK